MRTVMKDLCDWFWSLDFFRRRMVFGCTVVVVFMTVVFWRVMIPMILLAALVSAYLRYSRAKDSL